MSDTAEQEYIATLDQIRDLKIAIRKNSRERQRLYTKMEKVRAEYVLAIGKEKDEKGKLIFSNESMRNAELVIRLHSNKKYMELQGKRLEIDENSDDLSAEHNRLTDIKYMQMIKLGIPVEINEDDDKIIEFH